MSTHTQDPDRRLASHEQSSTTIVSSHIHMHGTALLTTLCRGGCRGEVRSAGRGIGQPGQVRLVTEIG